MYVIRHGQSVFNQAFNETGKDPGIIDAPLTPRGFKQAAMAADSLKGKGITHIVSSPYSRALQTAGVIAETLKLKIAVEPLVGERSLYSCDIGTPTSELKKSWPQVDFARLDAEEWWPRAHETDENLARRARAFEVLSRQNGHGPHTLVVSHWYMIFTLTDGLDSENAQVIMRDGAGKWHKWPA